MCWVGIDGVRRIHHIAGVLLLFVFVYHIISVLWTFVEGRFEPIWPRFQDAKDAAHAVRYLLGRQPDAPRYDRYDFRQKLEYWGLIWGTFLMGLTASF